MKYQWQIKKHLTLFKKYFQLDEYHITHDLYKGGQSRLFTREVFERGNVVAVLLFDPEAVRSLKR